MFFMYHFLQGSFAIKIIIIMTYTVFNSKNILNNRQKGLLNFNFNEMSEIAFYYYN